MTLTPSCRLYGLGVTLLMALTICARHLSNTGEPPFMVPLAIAGVSYLLAIRELLCTPSFPKRVVVYGLAIAAVWHVLFLRMPPGLDDDIHRYVWDGRVQRLGYNPYVVIPNDPALAGLHTSETRTLNNPHLPSPYPPGAQLFFRTVTGIHESIFAFKVAFVLCDVAIVIVLLDILRYTRQKQHWVLAFAWHPLLATEVAGSGHIDILGALLLLLSMAALVRRRRTLAAIAFSLAVAVKLVPIVLLPLYWKRVRLRDAALAGVITAVLYLPYLNHGRIPIGSLGVYVQRWRFNDLLFSTLTRVATPQVATGLAVFAGLATAAWMRRRYAKLSADAYALPMTASFLFAPVVYPWYLLWLLPFMRSVSALPIIVWSVSIIPTYYVWHLRRLGLAWAVPGWIMLLEYGSVAVAAAMAAFLQTRRLASLRQPVGR